MDFEFETKRTGLANAFAAAGAELLAYMGVGAALAAIPDTEPQQYAVAGTLGMIGKMLPVDERLLSSPAAGEEQTGDLTDEQIKKVAHEAVKSGALSWTGFEEDERGFYTVPSLSPCHYQFARAIARAAIAAHLARKPKAEHQEQRSNELHNAIMNLPCKRADHEFMSAEHRMLYKNGHRDARHAAAELALGASVAPAGAQKEDAQ